MLQQQIHYLFVLSVERSGLSTAGPVVPTRPIAAECRNSSTTDQKVQLGRHSTAHPERHQQCVNQEYYYIDGNVLYMGTEAYSILHSKG